MARAEKIVVELSPRDRRLLKDIVDALSAKVSVSLDTLQDNEGKPIKRLTEPAIDGEGDWQLQNEEKVGEDD